ncbi:PDZ domain-containing protein [Gardnerella sp. DNF01205]|uniref:YlbL family protein n=1 Tax=Gardnerella sp. DNF01205 TaxID=2749069 RepID=UPI003BAB55ED
MFRFSTGASVFRTCFRFLRSLPHALVVYITSHSLRYFAGFFTVVVAIFALSLPSAYVVEEPGPTQDVLGSLSNTPVIDMSGSRVKENHDTGKLLLITVNVSGVPGYEVSTFYSLTSWMDPHKSLLPREAIVPVGQSADEYEKESTNEMDDSQSLAQNVALQYASKHLGIKKEDVKVRLHIEDIGGPSAGMMYTLGIIDKLTPEQETGGKTIAGTGTIEKSQKIGEIGGIRLKMIAAKRDGATWFLAPYDNCNEVVGHVPQGLRVVSVKTLDDAYRALKAIGSGHGANKLPSCNVK